MAELCSLFQPEGFWFLELRGLPVEGCLMSPILSPSGLCWDLWSALHALLCPFPLTAAEVWTTRPGTSWQKGLVNTGREEAFLSGHVQLEVLTNLSQSDGWTTFTLNTPASCCQACGQHTAAIGVGSWDRLVYVLLVCRALHTLACVHVYTHAFICRMCSQITETEYWISRVQVHFSIRAHVWWSLTHVAHSGRAACSLPSFSDRRLLSPQIAGASACFYFLNQVGNSCSTYRGPFQLLFGKFRLLA